MKIKHIFTAIAMASTLAFGITAANADDLTAAQKSQVQGIVHDYIIANPDVIITAVQGMQQKQMEQMRTKGAQAALKNIDALFKLSSDPVAGNAKGKVTIVEFFDYQCPHCVDMDPVFTSLLKANPDVRVVYKEFPIRGAVSTYAAKAALASNLQGKYAQFHEALMQSAKDLNEAKIIELAQGLGLDVKKLKVDMDGPVVTAQIKGTYKLAQSIGIYGTPAIFVASSDLSKDSGEGAVDFIPGQVDQKYLQDSIDKASGKSTK
jgi:protein-disulfide isomerase